MKIQLERNLNSGSCILRCTVCEGVYYPERLRKLLCHDNGFVVGDICAKCCKQNTIYIHKKLHARAVKLIDRPLTSEDLQTPSPHKQALEISELTHQPLTVPPFYAWLWKYITVSFANVRELNPMRTSPLKGQFRQTKNLKISFLSEEPSIADADGKSSGKDN
jgi:hypothetical protein